MDGLGEAFSNGADHAHRGRESEVHDLHAKIGQLVVERDFLSEASSLILGTGGRKR